LYFRATLHLELKHYQEAIEDYTSAIELHKSFANAYYHRGICKGILGDTKGAIYDMIAAAQLGTRFAQKKLNEKGIVWQGAVSAVGYQLDKSGHDEEALQRFVSSCGQVGLGPDQDRPHRDAFLIYGYFLGILLARRIVRGQYVFCPPCSFPLFHFMLMAEKYHINTTIYYPCQRCGVLHFHKRIIDDKWMVVEE
jgi:tetratricopeptide (TPR) repeat protein